ncbi:MAG: acetyl-CoA C-acetyltransferase [Planctomycetes bacterium]|nr:acetyl-CoA C-acetyltransferase [Planctomycetota bacterium]
MPTAVVTHAFRTPIGRFLGGLSSLTSVELGCAVVKPLIERAGIGADEVQQLIFGNGRQAGAGPNPARQIAVRSGLSVTTTAYTMNMACASGLKSLVLAAREIESGDAEIVVAGGTESMSRLPYLLPHARDGYRLGHAPLVDAMYQDGFQCPLADQLMGATGENLAERDGIGRDRQDAFAVQSQTRCEAARKGGVFVDEIVPVEVPGRKGVVTLFEHDEHARDGVTIESMAKLKPVFKDGGSVHPGNSSGITDGAAALLVMSEDAARARGLEVLAVVEGSAEAGVDPRFMGFGPVPATEKLARKLGITIADWDLIELNEAFAVQALSCMDAWGIDADCVNVHGGAIALGHPIGATGARIVVTLLHAMKRRGAKRGLATLCVSGGMGMSVSFRRP